MARVVLKMPQYEDLVLLHNVAEDEALFVRNSMGATIGMIVNARQGGEDDWCAFTGGASTIASNFPSRLELIEYILKNTTYSVFTH